MNQERLEACRNVSVNQGSLGTDMKSTWEPGELGDMQESVCDSGESVKVLSLRALRARTGGGHVVAQLWTNLRPIWDQSGTNLRPTWDQFGNNSGQIWDQFGTKLGPTWDQTVTILGPVWDHFGQRK